MRIIGGTFKSRYIAVPRSFKARPTTDMAREGLFNILANHFEFNGLRILDLFGGTGSISFEFASRGAGQIDLVETNKRYSDFIKKNANKMNLDNLSIYRTDAFIFIRNTPDKYDIVFADPPYDMEGIDTLPDEVLSNGLLSGSGWFILEHGRKQDFSSHPSLRQQRKYGSVHFSMFT